MSIQGASETISAAFVRARRAGSILAEFPGPMPASLKEAYHIQDQAIVLAAMQIGGWKVGRVPDDLVSVYGAERLGGPIFADQIANALDGDSVEMPVLSGFAAVEAELLLKVGHVPDKDLTIEAAYDVVSEVRMGIEIASSPFPGINQHGPAVTVSDFGNNFGLVVGPAIENWREIDLQNARTQLEIDGEIQGDGLLANMLDGPFGSLVFAHNMLRGRGMSLKPGDWISTGAITGVHQIAAGSTATATFAKKFSVSCRTIPYVGQTNERDAA
jgi:2-keto-4-pentenoate hydratase